MVVLVVKACIPWVVRMLSLLVHVSSHCFEGDIKVSAHLCECEVGQGDKSTGDGIEECRGRGGAKGCVVEVNLICDAVEVDGEGGGWCDSVVSRWWA